MEQLQRHFQKILTKASVKRKDLVELKHESRNCNPQISNELAHILKDVICDVCPSKLEKLKKLYDKHF
jgi:hypothetical protein